VGRTASSTMARVGVKFGVLLIQSMPYGALVDAVRFAESLGLQNAWIADQLGIPSRPDATFLEAWTTLAGFARDTERIRIGPLVSNVAMRNPGMLAKHVLTVDHMSGGRVDLAIGAGYFPVEHAWVGVPFPDGPARSRRLEEAAAILDRGLRGEHVTFNGEFFQLADAPMTPAPTQRPRVPLYIAGQARASLEVAVRHADVLVTTSFDDAPTIDQASARLRDRMHLVDDLCRAAGRDPATLGRLYSAGYSEEGIFSSVDAMADWVGRLVEAGATELCFYLHDPAMGAYDELVESGQFASRDALAQLAHDVMPHYQAEASQPD
jgi:alkanesulfonate monooxygenase SsuD/methylene tetrahydromethanopterin reductase-like flavin-dependent oxidoreductase (luciferase family)